MNHLKYIFALFFIFVSIPDAHAQTTRLYFAGYMGLNTFNDVEFSEGTTSLGGDFELDNGLSFAGALGLRLSPNIRMEAEVTYAKNDFTSADFSNGTTAGLGGEVTSTLAMLNVYYDFNVDMEWDQFQPYIGAGLGYGNFDTEIDSSLTPDVSDDAQNFVWSVGGGLKYRINSDVAFQAGYRYLDAGELGVESYDLDYNSHEIRIGFEYDLHTY